MRTTTHRFSPDLSTLEELQKMLKLSPPSCKYRYRHTHIHQTAKLPNCIGGDIGTHDSIMQEAHVPVQLESPRHSHSILLSLTTCIQQMLLIMAEYLSCQCSARSLAECLLPHHSPESYAAATTAVHIVFQKPHFHPSIHL